MKVNISEVALYDIENIWVYSLENWSKEQADRYYNLIFEEIDYITKNSEYGRDFSHIRKGYRYSKVKSHLIFYRISKENIIEIVRVLHARMDFDNILAE